jgi:hypothetical protein
MADFFDQARILAVIFESDHKDDITEIPMSFRILQSEQYFKFMHVVGRLGPMLNYLYKTVVSMQSQPGYTLERCAFLNP